MYTIANRQNIFEIPKKEGVNFSILLSKKMLINSSTKTIKSISIYSLNTYFSR